MRPTCGEIIVNAGNDLVKVAISASARQYVSGVLLPNIIALYAGVKNFCNDEGSSLCSAYPANHQPDQNLWETGLEGVPLGMLSSLVILGLVSAHMIDRTYLPKDYRENCVVRFFRRSTLRSALQPAGFVGLSLLLTACILAFSKVCISDLTETSERGCYAYQHHLSTPMQTLFDETRIGMAMLATLISVIVNVALFRSRTSSDDESSSSNSSDDESSSSNSSDDESSSSDEQGANQSYGC